MNVRRDAKYALLGVALVGSLIAGAQTRRSQPVNDSAAQSSPTGPVLNTPATDASAEASPIDPTHAAKGRGIAPHTALHVVLTDGIDSGNLKNGQAVHGKLQNGGSAGKSGTPVLLTVVGTVPAGKLNAVGEISQEVVRVGGIAVETNILTYRGQPGHRDLPDSAPMIGTNAGLPAGTAMTFVVQPQPSFAQGDPGSGKFVPGSVTEHVSGSKPPNYGQPAVSSAPGSGVDKTGAPLSDGGGTPQPAQNTGQGTAAPNQMTAPSNASPTSTAQPH